MAIASLVQPGFAIRRLSCLVGLEVPCGSTGVDGFFGCCPSSLVCDPNARNRYCCPPGDNSCTESELAAKPQPPCANATWDLFDNGGYYCCEHDVQAYNRSDTNWCGKPSGSRYSTMAEITLSRLREGVATDPATIVSTTSSSPTPSSSPTSPSSTPSSIASESTSSTTSSPPSSSESSSTPVGAIAGGVVGGIAGLALLIFLTWFFLRRRRQAHTPELNGETHTPYEKYASTSASGGAVYEVGEHESRMPIAEMAGNTKPVELDGTGTMRS